MAQQASTTLELQSHYTVRPLSVDKLNIVISRLYSSQITYQILSFTGLGIGTTSKICSEHCSDLSKSTGSVLSNSPLTSMMQSTLLLCNTAPELQSMLPHDLGSFQDFYCASVLSTNLNSVFGTPCAQPCPTLPVPYPFLVTLTEAL